MQARPRPAVVSALVGLVLVVAAMVVPLLLDEDVRVHFPPLHAWWGPRLDPLLLVAVAAGVLLWSALPRLRLELPWRVVVVLTTFAGWLWTCALGLSDGRYGFARVYGRTSEYPHDAQTVRDVPAMLREFVERIPSSAPDNWHTHVAGHPPGALLSFVLLDRLGVQDPFWIAMVVVTVGATSVAAVLLTLDLLGTRDLARRAAPWLALAPLVVWAGVSADWYFAAVAAWGLYLLARAATSRGPRAWAQGVAAGLLLGWCVYLSYGLVLLGVLALTVLWLATRTPRAGGQVASAPALGWRALPWALGGALVVTAVFSAFGFHWWEAYPVLRERYSGKAEYVVNFFEYIAEEVREYLAELGFRTLDEAIGQVAALDVQPAVDHWKAHGLDLSPILHVPDGSAFPDQDLRCTKEQDHALEVSLDVTELVPLCQPAIEKGEPVRAQLPIRNVNRTVGTILGHEVTKKYRGEGLPEGTIDLTFTGSAGQSFGAFVPKGITLRLEGDSNDYVGKGLSGGRIVVRPDRSAPFRSNEQIIAGNTIAYGATSGNIFIRGGVGERCCVRNSGAWVVTEGVGDHAAEYMTGGRLVVLGKTGRNFAAGMSGGIAWVLDLKDFRVNKELVELGPVKDQAAVELEGLVRAHLEETGSEVAAELLEDWESSLTRFTERDRSEDDGGAAWLTPRAF